MAGRVAVCAAVLAAAAGCGAECALECECDPPIPVSVDPDGTTTQFVVDSITMPASAIEAQRLGVDLDDDPQQRPDNAFAQILNIFASRGGGDLNAQVEALIQSGTLLVLVELQATSLVDADGVGVAILHGIDADGDPSNNFSGTGTFDVDTVREPGLVTGGIEDGTVAAGQGAVQLALPLRGRSEPLFVPLRGVRVRAEVDGDRLAGRIGGAFSEETVTDVIVPAMHEDVAEAIVRDCSPSGCIPDSYGDLLLRLLDENEDGEVTLEEMQSNDLLSSLLDPDLDLIDGNGNFNSHCDGWKELLSVGIGFTAVPAIF